MEKVLKRKCEEKCNAEAQRAQRSDKEKERNTEKGYSRASELHGAEKGCSNAAPLRGTDFGGFSAVVLTRAQA